MKRHLKRIIVCVVATMIIISTAHATNTNIYYLTDELSRVKTQHDNGFSKVETIENNDPHYDWGLGVFYIQGYSETIKNDDEEVPTFLIKGENQITLCFRLDQDIYKLNDKADLKVNDDSNGFDEDLNVKIERFGRGCLIIQKTNNDGSINTDAYPNFLSAVAENSLTANIGPLDEGKYKVALDYELQSGSILPGYNDYKIAFSFEIQNSNNHYAAILGIDLSNIQTIIIISTIIGLIILFLIAFLIHRKRSRKRQLTTDNYLNRSAYDQTDALVPDQANEHTMNLGVVRKIAGLPTGTKKKIAVGILLIISILCITLVGPWMSRPTTYLGPITYLDEKSSTAAILTTGATALSIVITALPGDMGTPTANELSKVSSILFLVTCLIFAEKYFITTIGFFASSIIIPLACLLMVFCILLQHEYRKRLAEWSIRLLIFGICIAIIIPIGCAVGRGVEAIDQDTIIKALHTAEQANDYVAQAKITVDEKNEVKIESAMSELTKQNGIVKWITDAFNEFKNEAAKMLITAILLPVLMLVAFIGAIKVLLKKDYTQTAVRLTQKFTGKASKQITGIGKIAAEQRKIIKKRRGE